MATTTSTPAPIVKRHALVIAQSVGVPLMAFETTDPAQTIAGCVSALRSRNVPILRWDCIRGLVSLNTIGNNFLSAVAPTTSGGQEATIPPVNCLSLLASYYAGFDNNSSRKGAINDAIIFYMNAHRFIDNEGVVQALWNIRDTFKSHGSTLVMLAPMIKLPAELTHDVVVVTEPLPTAEEVAKIVDSIAQSANPPTFAPMSKIRGASISKGRLYSPAQIFWIC